GVLISIFIGLIIYLATIMMWVLAFYTFVSIVLAGGGAYSLIYCARIEWGAEGLKAGGLISLGKSTLATISAIFYSTLCAFVFLGVWILGNYEISTKITITIVAVICAVLSTIAMLARLHGKFQRDIRTSFISGVLISIFIGLIIYLATIMMWVLAFYTFVSIVLAGGGVYFLIYSAKVETKYEWEARQAEEEKEERKVEELRRIAQGVAEVETKRLAELKRLDELEAKREAKEEREKLAELEARKKAKEEEQKKLAELKEELATLQNIPNFFVDDIKTLLSQNKLDNASKLLSERKKDYERYLELVRSLKDVDDKTTKLSSRLAEGEVTSDAYEQAMDELKRKKYDIEEELGKIQRKIFREKYEKPF
ncbi:MAG: hypothetical protein L6265_11955, partial [Thermoplasmatales archaeon]|nr:hypothetical protein [Thermoplasmatales archaeon]